MDYATLSIEELDKELNRRDALRQAGKTYNREETKTIMEIRNKKIAAESLHRRLNPTQVIGLPNEDRLNTLRAKAGVAVVGAGGAVVEKK